MSYCKTVTYLLEMHPTDTTTMSQHGVQSGLKEFEEAGLSTGLQISQLTVTNIINKVLQISIPAQQHSCPHTTRGKCHTTTPALSTKLPLLLNN